MAIFTVFPQYLPLYMQLFQKYKHTVFQKLLKKSIRISPLKKEIYKNFFLKKMILISNTINYRIKHYLNKLIFIDKHDFYIWLQNLII